MQNAFLITIELDCYPIVVSIKSRIDNNRPYDLTIIYNIIIRELVPQCSKTAMIFGNMIIIYI